MVPDARFAPASAGDTMPIFPIPFEFPAAFFYAMCKTTLHVVSYIGVFTGRSILIQSLIGNGGNVSLKMGCDLL